MKTTKTLTFSIAFLLCFFFNTLKAQTPTILGGEISYQCIGLNTYTVFLNVYADCLGADLPDSVSLDLSSSCLGTNSGTLIMPKLAGFPIDITSNIFPGASSCNGGTGTRGVKNYLYTDTLVLGASCSSMHLSWLSCCRNDSLNAILSPSTTSFYLETTLNNIPVICNSSVVFSNYPIVGACVGIPSVYHQGAFDPDGDSLIFSLVSCLEDSSDAVSYLSGISGIFPFGAGNVTYIDPQTGQINYTVPAGLTSLICVVVEEVRGGVVISSTLREIAIIGLNCQINNIPIITGIDSTSSYDTTVLVGQPFCFDIHGEDLDANQQLLMSWNNGIAGATFTIDTSNQPIGTFCWTPTAQDTGQHTFLVEVNDFAPPVPGVAIEQFRIQVNTALSTNQPTDISIQNQFKIYPNPAKDKIQLVFDFRIEKGFDLRIVDAQGKIIQDQTQIKTRKLALDIHDLTVGLYSIIIITEEGQALNQTLIVR
jgi:hypothetical protein